MYRPTHSGSYSLLFVVSALCLICPRMTGALSRITWCYFRTPKPDIQGSNSNMTTDTKDQRDFMYEYMNILDIMNELTCIL